MSAPPPVPMPDFGRMAARFDRFLPQIHPVTLALLDHLPPLADGAAVLDVACGTGEPGLSLARKAPGVRLLGVDSTPAMIDVARSKVATESLQNARFEVMSSDVLTAVEAYRIGVDDLVQVAVWRNPELGVTVPVRRDAA